MTTPTIAAPAAPGNQPEPNNSITIPQAPPSVEPEKPETTPQVFTAEDLEKARREEKEKLYNRLNERDEALRAAQAELESTRKAREEQEAAEAAARAKAEAEAKSKAEAEMSAKELLEARQREWEEKFNQLESERAREREVFAREQELAELQQYQAQRLSAEAENIAPELLDFAGGNSREEIDASIERLKAKSQQIVQSMTQAQVAARASMRGTSTTGFGTGPAEAHTGQRTFTADDIKNMPMAEYAKYRHQLVPAAIEAQRGKGLFS